MFHNNLCEVYFIAFMSIAILLGVFLTCFARPDGPEVYPYSEKYPESIMGTEVQKNVHVME